MRVAIWLLARFGVDEALLGDVVEQRNAGRSHAWLWRQVAGAIVSELGHDLTAHPLRTPIAVLTALLVRCLTVQTWGQYERVIDVRMVPMLDVLSPLGPHAWIVALSWANSVLLAPAWLLIGFVLARFSRPAVPIFMALAIVFLLPGVTRQLQSAIASDLVRWLLPIQLTIFATSIATFAVSTLVGAACGSRRISIRASDGY